MKLKMRMISRKTFFVHLVAIVGACCCFWNSYSWQFATVGDDFAVYETACNVANNIRHVSPFSFDGIYGGSARIMPSYWQALFLLVFGKTYYVLKAALAVMLYLTAICFYKFWRALFGKEVAIVGLILFSFQYFVSNTFKIDTINMAMFLLALANYLLVRLLGRPTWPRAIALGIVLGFSFYNFFGPVILVFLLPYLIIFYRRHGVAGRKFVMSVLLLYVLMAGVGLATNPKYLWFAQAERTSFGRLSELQSYEDFWWNIPHTFLLFFDDFNNFHNRYVGGAYFDIVSQVLIVVGLLVALFRFRKKEGIIVALWTVQVLAVAVTNPYPYVPYSRGTFFVPYGVIFAAWGVKFLARFVGPLFLRRGLVVLTILLVTVLNIDKAQRGVFEVDGFYTPTALILKEIMMQGTRQPPFLVVSSQPEGEDIRRNLQILTGWHSVPEGIYRFSREPLDVCRVKSGTVLYLASDPFFKRRNLSDICGHMPTTVKVKVIDPREYHRQPRGILGRML